MSRPNVNPAVNRAVQLLRPGVPAMADAMTAAVLAELPTYRDLPDLDAFQAGLAQTVEQFLDMAAAGATELPGEARARLRELGAQRARQGFRAVDVLGGLQISMHCGWRCMARSLATAKSSADSGVAIAELPVVLVRFVAAVQAELLEGHHAGEPVLDRHRAELLEDLLTGSFSNEEELLERARTTDLDLAGDHSLILLIGPDAARDMTSVSRSVIASLPGALTVAMAGRHPPHLALLIPCRPHLTQTEARSRLAVLAGRHAMTALVASWRVSTGMAPASYRDAAETTTLVAAASLRGVVTIDELLPHRCLQAIPRDLLQLLVDRTLRALLRLRQHDQDRLIETLRALHTHGNHAGAAADLGVHTNTIRRCCHRVRDLTGLDLDHPPDRFRLDLAIHALPHLHPGTTPDPDSADSGGVSDTSPWWVSATVLPAQRALPSQQPRPLGADTAAEVGARSRHGQVTHARLSSYGRAARSTGIPDNI